MKSTSLSSNNTPTPTNDQSMCSSQPSYSLIQSWYQTHYFYPYPTFKEKMIISYSSGLDFEQIEQYLRTERSRKYNQNEIISSSSLISPTSFKKSRTLQYQPTNSISSSLHQNSSPNSYPPSDPNTTHPTSNFHGLSASLPLSPIASSYHSFPLYQEINQSIKPLFPFYIPSYQPMILLTLRNSNDINSNIPNHNDSNLSSTPNQTCKFSSPPLHQSFISSKHSAFHPFHSTSS